MKTSLKQISNLQFVLIGAKILFILCLPVSKCDDNNTSTFNVEDYKNYSPWNLLKSIRNLHDINQNVIIRPTTPIEDSDILDFKKTFIAIDTKVTSPPYKEVLMEYIKNVSVINVPLSGEEKLIENSLNEINDLLKNNSNGKIQLQIKPKDLDASVAIFNSLYFKVQWRTEFKFKLNSTFHQAPNKAIQVAAVETIDNFYYIDSLGLDAKMIRLPLSDPDIAMYILLPHTKVGANQLLQNLNNDQLKRLQWMMEETRVRVVMPKFSFSFYFKVNLEADDILYNLFLEQNIFDKSPDIFQISGIDVHGYGGKMDIPPKGNSMNFENFIIDRPFVFYIEKENTGQILCIGKVNDPSV